MPLDKTGPARAHYSQAKRTIRRAQASTTILPRTPIPQDRVGDLRADQDRARGHDANSDSFDHPAAHRRSCQRLECVGAPNRVAAEQATLRKSLIMPPLGGRSSAEVLLVADGAEHANANRAPDLMFCALDTEKRSRISRNPFQSPLNSSR